MERKMCTVGPLHYIIKYIRFNISLPVVLSQTFVEDAVKLLVTRFIPLDPSDLEEWMSDPEEWVNVEEHENDQWEYALRVSTISCISCSCILTSPKPCGERVLMTLAHQYRGYVVPLLRTTFQQLVCTYTLRSLHGHTLI